MGQPVVHFEIMGRDAGTLHKFYGDLFGWNINVPPGAPVNYGIIDRSDNPDPHGEITGIGGGIGAEDSGQANHVTFYVGVPDVEAALVKAESLGGKRLMGPERPAPGVVVGLFHDPEGHMVGVVTDESGGASGA